MQKILFLILFSCFALLSIAQDDVFLIVEGQPKLQEGMTGFMEYIKKNIKYPQSGVKSHVEGKVFLQFTVDKYGKLTNIKVLKGLHFDCDKEAVRVLKEYPNEWINRKRKNVEITIPIIFRENLRYKK